MKRREVKGKHEESVLESFRKFMIPKGVDFQIIDRPDPPDAIVSLGKENTWIEITDAFFNSELAKSITSYPAEDVPHVPTKRKLIKNPDQVFESIVQEVILKKYENNTIFNVFQKYGPGVLLVGLFSPFIGEDEIKSIIVNVKNIKKNDNRFREIYLYDRSHSFYSVI